MKGETFLLPTDVAVFWVLQHVFNSDPRVSVDTAKRALRKVMELHMSAETIEVVFSASRPLRSLHREVVVTYRDTLAIEVKRMEANRSLHPGAPIKSPWTVGRKNPTKLLRCVDELLDFTAGQSQVDVRKLDKIFLVGDWCKRSIMHHIMKINVYVPGDDRVRRNALKVPGLVQLVGRQANCRRIDDALENLFGHQQQKKRKRDMEYNYMTEALSDCYRLLNKRKFEPSDVGIVERMVAEVQLIPNANKFL